MEVDPEIYRVLFGRPPGPERLLTPGALDVEARVEELHSRGGFLSVEVAMPIVRARFQKDGGFDGLPRFAGTGTVIGGDLLLTAKHVADVCVENPEDVPMAVFWRVGPPATLTLSKIRWFECHPDCDLAVAKVLDHNSRCPWDGFGRIASLMEVSSMGYPFELMAPMHSGDLEIVMSTARYLRGYVSLGSETMNDPSALPVSMETSFSFSEGMSGSPIWGTEPVSGKRLLVGIAIGTRTMSVGIQEAEAVDEHGHSMTLRVPRTRDYGVAIRLTGAADWRVKTCGRFLGELVPNDATGEMPDHLRPENILLPSGSVADGWRVHSRPTAPFRDDGPVQGR